MKAVSAKVDEDMIAEIDRAAELLGLPNRSAVLRAALNVFMEGLKFTESLARETGVNQR